MQRGTLVDCPTLTWGCFNWWVELSVFCVVLFQKSPFEKSIMISTAVGLVLSWGHCMCPQFEIFQVWHLLFQPATDVCLYIMQQPIAANQPPFHQCLQLNAHTQSAWAMLILIMNSSSKGAVKSAILIKICVVIYTCMSSILSPK